ncbi:alpha/beta fold hydrolase [Streptomyces sp. NPDC048172]|uniref:alpha/beta fold hydrolase n=1 Tax=Streptomyces sp. NPDC048172 TaxID=3365505 RepID=UPI0037140D1B
MMDDLFHLDTGSGRPLVLLHGGFLDHRMWDDQIPALAARHRVIAPDARGHGRSALATAPYRLADELAALLRRLDTRPAVLIGVSMGAGVAVDTALEHPDVVEALVLSGAGTSEPHFEDPWTTATLAAQHAAMAAGDLDGAVEAAALFAAGPHRPLDAVEPAVVERVRRMARATMSRHTRDEPNLLVQVGHTWSRLPGIGVPVLSVNGALDSPDHLAMSARLTDAVPQARTRTLSGAAHYPNMERPRAYNAAVEDFLAALPAARRRTGPAPSPGK